VTTALGVAVGDGVSDGVGVGVAEETGLDVCVGVGLAGGADFFDDDEHPATARLTPQASATATGRVRALLVFTVSGYLHLMWPSRAATLLAQIDIRR
jgi:hypothetical protein